MAGNIWGAGQDALLNFLTDRDAERRLEEDRARRDRLDQENAADRSLGREIQQGQLRSIDEDREARRNTAAATAAQKAQENAAIQGALQVAAAATADPKAVAPEKLMEAMATLDFYNVDPKNLNSLKPKTVENRPVYERGPGGQIRQIGEVPTNAHIVTPVNPPRPPAERPTVPTPAQATAARSQAQRIARQDERAGRIPPDMTLKQYEDELYRETLAGAGFDVPPAPPRPPAQPPQGRAMTDSRPDKAVRPDIDLGPGGPPAAAPPPIQMEPGSLEAAAQQVLTQALRRPATAEDIAKFLNDPQNIAELQRMPGR